MIYANVSHLLCGGVSQDKGELFRGEIKNPISIVISKESKVRESSRVIYPSTIGSE